MDEYGRKVILRGINFSDRSKRPPFLPQMSFNEIDRLKEWGFNSVRFLILWEAIEPEEGSINEEYIEAVKTWVDEFKRREMYVILDMHQDLYARKLGGDGAPEWAVKECPYEPIDVWYLNYLQPAVILNFDRFWKNEDNLQEHYINSWLEVVRRFKNERYVLGYELMNEPYSGSIPFINCEFESKYLHLFYEKLIRKIREVDPHHIVFFEPSIWKGGGLVSCLSELPFDNIVYAPHYYDPFVMWVFPYNGDERRTESAFVLNEKEASRMGVPWILGEFGILFNTENSEEYLEDHMRLIERFMIGSFYWNYNTAEEDEMSPVSSDGSERCWDEKLCMKDVLSRPYPSFVNGEPIEFSFDRDKKEFTLRFISEGEDVPTEVVVPAFLIQNEIIISLNRGYYDFSYETGIIKIYAEKGVEGLLHLSIR